MRRFPQRSEEIAQTMRYRDIVIARQMKKAAIAGTEAKMISCIPSEAFTRQISDIPTVSLTAKTWPLAWAFLIIRS